MYKCQSQTGLHKCLVHSASTRCHNLQGLQLTAICKLAASGLSEKAFANTATTNRLMRNEMKSATAKRQKRRYFSTRKLPLSVT